MYIVMWTFEVMEGKNRNDLLIPMKGAAPKFKGVPGLIHKCYGIAGDARSVVEIYLWKSKADADKFYDADWEAETFRRWESPRMTRRDFDSPVVVEAEQGRVIIDA